MSKLFFKIFIFITLFFIVLKWLDGIFIIKNAYSFSRNHYENIDENIDIAIFGSSHAYRSYDPRVLEVELGLRTYNFGSSSQHLIVTEAVMDDVFSANEVKLAIVDIFGLTIQPIAKNNEQTKNFQINAMDNLDYSYSKHKAYDKIFGIAEFYNLSPTIRNHVNWNTKLEKSKFQIKEDEDFYNGFLTAFRFNKKRWDLGVAQTKRNKSRNKGIKELTKDQKTIIDNLITKAKQYNVPIIFVSSPFFHELGEKASSYQKLVEEYIDTKEVRHVYYNDLWKEIGLNKFDFQDLDHLNTKGALKVSLHISKYINNNFDLTTNQNEEIYKNNRYAIIENKEKNVLAKKIIRDSLITKRFGLEKIYLFEVYENRYELLLEGEIDKFKSLTTCLQYVVNDIPNESVSTKNKNKNKKNSRNEISKTCNWLSGPFVYNNKKYLTFQFNSNLDEMENFKFYVGPEKDVLIFDFKNLKLKNRTK